MTIDKIAGSYGGHCVDRAVSTMRAVLGYDKGLPDGWTDDPDDRCGLRVIELCSLAFPDQEMLVWCREENYTPSANGSYQGTVINSESRWDNYLFAFVYGDAGGDKGHMVVGFPAAYGDMQISLVVGVKMR